MEITKGITEMQKAAADNMIEQKITTGKVNRGKALLDAGYSKATSLCPTTVTETKGFKEYMAKHGITEDNLAGMLAADLEAKVGERLGEMKLAAELMGLTNKDLNLNVKQVDEGLALMRNILDGNKE